MNPTNTKNKGKIIHRLKVTIVTGITTVLLTIFLSPFLFMIFTSLQTVGQISLLNGPIWPAAPGMADYKGKQTELYTVPLSKCEGFSPTDSSTASLVIIKKGRLSSVFADPANQAKGEFTCNLSWRALERPWKFAPTWGNYAETWGKIAFANLLLNTLAYALVTAVGTLLSCTLVAYGFARYRFPGRETLFIVLISTLFLPGFVTLVPTYLLFKELGWIGTWLPLYVPAFFGTAFNIFLLRQYFLTLPRELDEAAMIDGAGPLRILWMVIIPQSYPVLMAVFVFHIVYSWNDYFGPLIYLGTSRSLWPISVGLDSFNSMYGSNPPLVQAGAMMALVLPLILFLMAQRLFIQGIVVTGVEK